MDLNRRSSFTPWSGVEIVVGDPILDVTPGVLPVAGPKPDLEATMGDDAANAFEVGYTPLQVACYHRAFRSVKTRLEAGADPRVLTPDKYGLIDIVLRNDIAKYLMEKGATVNTLSPNYGSKLHLATSDGSMDLVKLLLKAGADPDLVDLEYSESHLYTALGIQDERKLKEMVRYLVDEAKVPVEKLGGKFGYPILRATHRASHRDSPYSGHQLVRFLIKRKVRLDVSDNQGRRAVHFACKLPLPDSLKTLVTAGTDIHSADKFGRKPIHFTASNPYNRCLDYLLEILGSTDVDVKDHDQWSPWM
ncbi:ankyrin repeat [Fusarium pseudocircinatum]|uniref:Ankyrin repeat n=1 Tax=Fusarium pseudocircinatum TaxID=56676 RepID=A0A8H5L7Q2_9HYPO|nr:ankyrin repeat [Fusarium pseudocircinatum]